MSEEFKYGTAENMSETNDLRQGCHYLLTKSLGKDFNGFLRKMLIIGQVLCNLLLLLPLYKYSTLLVLVNLYIYFEVKPLLKEDNSDLSPSALILLSESLSWV